MVKISVLLCFAVLTPVLRHGCCVYLELAAYFDHLNKTMSTDEPMLKDLNNVRSISELILTSRSADGKTTKRETVDEEEWNTAQHAFKIWNVLHEKRNRQPCVKRTKYTYIPYAHTTIQEVECRTYSLYCASYWTACKAKKTYSSVAKKIITTSCVCKT